MKTVFYSAWLIIIGIIVSMGLESCLRMKGANITSPHGNINLGIGVKEGRLFYTIQNSGLSVIDTSFVSIKLKEKNLGERSKISKVLSSSCDVTWENLHGEEEKIRNNYNEIIVDLIEDTDHPVLYSVIFRVYDDGVGFRYSIPEQNNLLEINLLDEETQFNLAEDAVAWPIPFMGKSQSWQPSLISHLDTIGSPLTMKITDRLFLSIHEAGRRDYAPMGLVVKKGSSCLKSCISVSEDKERKLSKTRLETPWRTIMIAETPGGLLLSRLNLNLDHINSNVIGEKLDDINNSSPAYTCILPFTHFLGKSFSNYRSWNNETVGDNLLKESTLARQLALGVILMGKWDDLKTIKLESEDNKLDFFSSFPESWSLTVVPGAKIGEYLSVARKDINSDSWFLGAITNEQARDPRLSLDFLDSGYEYNAKIFCDAELANYLTNPDAITVKEMKVNSKMILPLHLAPGGGSAIIFSKIKS